MIKGSVVTLDAMGCQKNIVQKIVGKGGDYVISLKGNQSNLHADIKLFLDTEKENEFKNTGHDYYETTEKGHGRVETRRYWITDKVKWINTQEEWSGLQSIGMVESERYMKGKASCETRYFICSLSRDAKKFAQAVRQHWTVENNL